MAHSPKNEPRGSPADGTDDKRLTAAGSLFSGLASIASGIWPLNLVFFVAHATVQIYFVIRPHGSTPESLSLRLRNRVATAIRRAIVQIRRPRLGRAATVQAHELLHIALLLVEKRLTVPRDVARVRVRLIVADRADDHSDTMLYPLASATWNGEPVADVPLRVGVGDVGHAYVKRMDFYCHTRIASSVNSGYLAQDLVDHDLEDRHFAFSMPILPHGEGPPVAILAFDAVAAGCLPDDWQDDILTAILPRLRLMLHPERRDRSVIPPTVVSPQAR